MKILHITKKYPKAMGGDAIAVSNIEKQQRKARNKVVVLTSNCVEIATDKTHHTFGLRDTPANLDKITIRRLLSLPALTVKAFQLIRSERPDVVHTHSIDMAFAASFATRWFKVPLVHTFHILTFPDPHHGIVRRKSELWFLRGAKPHIVTAPNPTDVAHLKEAGVKNAEVLPLGIDLDFWTKKRTKAHKPFTFVTAARLEEQKGLVYLVRATALLKRRTKLPFKVVIVGDGSLKEELTQLAKRQKVQSYIEFAGPKTPEEVRTQYSQSDAMVIPSLWESGPLTAFEAWAMKLPLIITPVGMFADEPKDSKRALVVKPEDHKSLASAMEKLLSNNSLRRKLATAGHLEVQKHGWSAMTKTAKALYQQAKLVSTATPTKPTAIRTLHISKRQVVTIATLASIAALCFAKILSPTINTFVTLPLITLVPGLLMLLAGWPTLTKRMSMTLTLSASFGVLLIALESALINWLLPIAHRMQPLQAVYLLPLHLVATIALYGWYYQKSKHEDLTIPVRLATIAKNLLPLALPLLLALGAFRQNNGASNTITLLGFSLTALFGLWFVWKPKQWNASWLLFNMALGLLLSTSLRGWYIGGFDISQEFQVFTTTLQHHYWNIHALPGNAYNACLSLTTLPTTLVVLTHVGSEVIFKYFYQVLFALSAVVTYRIARQYIDRRLAFLAAFLYIAQTQFIGTMAQITRQEIGLIFFDLLIYYILDKKVIDRSRKALLIIISLGMVVSHYSTTYLAIMIFGVSALALIGGKFLHARLPKFPAFNTTVSAKNLIKLTVLLIILALCWYGQINNSSSNLTGTLKQAVNITHSHSLNTTTNKAALLLGTNPDSNNPKTVAEYANAHHLTGTIKAVSAPSLPVSNRLLNLLTTYARDVITIVIKVVLPLSPIVLLWRKKTRSEASDIAFVGLGAVAVFAAVIILPGLSINYNLQRVYQQCLIILGATGLWALWQLLPGSQRIRTIILSLFAIGFFVLSPGSGLINQAIGGIAPRMDMNSYGEEYNQYYVHQSEVLGAQWLAQNCKGEAAWADRYATLRLTAYGVIPYNNIRDDILNAKRGCLYLDYANTQNNLYYATYKKNTLRYTTSTNSFAGDNLVYNNGESRVYQY